MPFLKLDTLVWMPATLRAESSLMWCHTLNLITALHKRGSHHNNGLSPLERLWVLLSVPLGYERRKGPSPVSWDLWLSIWWGQQGVIPGTKSQFLASLVSGWDHGMEFWRKNRKVLWIPGCLKNSLIASAVQGFAWTTQIVWLYFKSSVYGNQRHM